MHKWEFCIFISDLSANRPRRHPIRYSLPFAKTMLAYAMVLRNGVDRNQPENVLQGLSKWKQWSMCYTPRRFI